MMALMFRISAACGAIAAIIWIFEGRLLAGGVYLCVAYLATLAAQGEER